MAEFYIKPPKTFSYSYKLKECANRLDHYARETGNIRNDLNNAFSGSGSVSSELKELIEQFGKEKGFALLLKKGIEEIVLQYFKSESSIMDILLPNKGAYHVDSIVFDDEGGYGGDQGHMEQVYNWDPFKCWELLDYLKQYYPHMTIFDAFGYFSHLNSVGCGYVALANTIFMEYADRPDEFERIFGYPMYKDGDLNYDRLILDIYATTDLAGINDDDGDGRPDGMLENDFTPIMETFLRDKGVEVKTEVGATVDRENFRRISEKGGYVVMGYRHGNMYDENGNPHHIGGHAITVTGITEDGRYIVSSWGEKYYIDPSDLDDDDTFTIFYYD